MLLCKFQNTRTECLFVSLRVAGIFTPWCFCACFRHPAAAVRPAEMPGRQAGDGGVHCGRAPGVLQAAGGGGAGLCSQPWQARQADDHTAPCRETEVCASLSMIQSHFMYLSLSSVCIIVCVCGLLRIFWVSVKLLRPNITILLDWV